MSEEKNKIEEIKEEAEAKAEEVKKEAEAKAEEVKEKVEAKAEEAKKDVKKKAEEAKEKVKDAKKGKGKVLVPVICVVVILAVVAVFFILGMVNRGKAVDAYTAAQKAVKDGNRDAAKTSYQEAYSALYEGPFSFVSTMLMDNADEAKIQKAYILNVLMPENRAMDAADILNGTNYLTDEDKADIYAAFPGVGLTQVGAVVTLGSYEQDTEAAGLEPLEWIVLEVDKKSGAVLLMTKDVVGYDDLGWNRRGDETNTSYALSNLNSWCESDFYNDIKSDPDFKGKILGYKVETAPSKEGVSSGDPIDAHVFAPSVEDLEKYLTGDLAQYRVATNSKAAKQARNGTYWLRNAGEKAGFATAVDKEGNVMYGAAVSSNYGIRPMLWYDIGLSD